MRISTSMMHSNALSAMMRRQSDVSKTQTELSSGQRVQKPSDDPVAAVRIMQLEQSKSANTQYGATINAASSRLSQEEQSLTDTQNILQRVRELAIQSNSATLNAADRKTIVVELGHLNNQLLSIANRKDANGEYVFAGLSSGVQPFTLDANNAVSFAGTDAARSLQIGDSQFVQDGDSGQQVFMSIPQGNGVFVTAANAANTGTGVLSSSVIDASAWLPDQYTLRFTSPTDWYVETPLNVVMSGSNYVAGSPITFNGVQLAISGTPAAGDSFSISPSGTEDVFTTINNLSSALNSLSTTTASQALFQNRMNNALQQLDQAQANVLGIRTSVGARLAMLESIDTTRQDSALQIDTSLSALRDVDYAEAISRLTQQSTGLQAAQQSYMKIAQLSLFNYL